MTLMNIDRDTEILRTPCAEVDLGDLLVNRQKYEDIFADMLAVMQQNNGIGLAANQAGYSLRMCIVAVSRTPIYMINPRIAFLSGERNKALEGCLSCPGEQVIVRRSSSATINYYDLNGTLQKLRTNGLTARCVQHEVDHLDGIVIRDHAKERAPARFMGSKED